MQATSIINRRNLHLLENQSPHDALWCAQMCDERICFVYLRHHGIVIYMKTPCAARGTQSYAIILPEWMMAYIPREKERRHPDQMDRGRIKFAPRNKQNKVPSLIRQSLKTHVVHGLAVCIMSVWWWNRAGGTRCSEEVLQRETSGF